MRTLQIDVDDNKLPTHTENEFLEWVNFELGFDNTISLDNPLENVDLVACWISEVE